MPEDFNRKQAAMYVDLDLSEKYISKASKISRIQSLLIKGSTVRVKIFDHSMDPTIKYGDHVVVKHERLEDLKPKDLILCTRGGELQVRRVARVIQRADEMTVEARIDTSKEITRYNMTQIAGKVVAAERKGTKLDLKPPGLMKTLGSLFKTRKR